MKTATLNDHVYTTMRTALICGRWTPGHGVSLRGLAAELDVSPMPIREAVSRLVAENALTLKDRRIYVPAMDEQRLLDLTELRLAIEPKLALRAFPAMNTKALHEIIALNDDNNRAIASGDTEGYILSNYHFHRAIYTRSNSAVLTPLVDQVWLQMGPFSRIVYGRLGTALLEDKHIHAIEAVKRGDATAFAKAVADDIEDGRCLLMGQPLPLASAGALVPRPGLQRDETTALTPDDL